MMRLEIGLVLAALLLVQLAVVAWYLWPVPPLYAFDFVRHDYRIKGKRVTLAETGLDIGTAVMTPRGLLVRDGDIVRLRPQD